MFTLRIVDMSWCCFELGRRNRRTSQQNQNELSCFRNVKLFSYDELRSATKNFHSSNKIGRGGFGIVYKGTLRSGRAIAAKVLSAESKQGVSEFLTEIDVISNLRHPNLVELIGCCVQGSNRILVYEFVENNSLDHGLLGPKSDTDNLNWGIRSAICLGTARGLKFLHEELEPHIVHRDIKASNILLDRNFAPKIGDFGLAKLFPDSITHISTRVAGTSGYLAPEYAIHGQLTKKADIYSFGVVLLEVISGRRASKTAWSEMEDSLVEWTWQLYEEGRLIEVVDPKLKDYPEEEVLRYTKVALFCTQAAAGRRPSMSLVVEMLSRPIRLNEKELTPPGIFEDTSYRGTNSNTSQKTSSSNHSTVPHTSTPLTLTEFGPR